MSWLTRFETLIVGLFAGAFLTVVIFGFASYQADHCGSKETSEASSPSKDQPTGAANNEDQEREEQITQYTKDHPWVCKVPITPGLVIGMMDHHEGFFVGSFTMALFAATILLWRSTQSLYEAGERQIEHIKTSADATMKVAVAAEQQAFAATAARLPILRFSTPDLHWVDEVIQGDGPYASAELTELPDRISIVPFIYIRNEGATDANTQIIYLGWSANGYFIKPVFGHTLLITPPIAAGSQQNYDTGPFHIILDNYLLPRIKSKISTLNFYIRVEYSDFTGCVWQENASWAWKQLSGTGAYAFLRDYEAPSHYNQKKKVWDPNVGALPRSKSDLL